MNPLASQSLRSVARELEQTAVAVGVVGTTRRKLKEMASLAEPVLAALKGERPEVDAVRTSLRQAIHNAKMANTKASAASDKLRALARVIARVQGLIQKGMGDVEAEYEVGPFKVMNVWGYQKSDVNRLKPLLEGAGRKLSDADQGHIVYGSVVLDPRQTSSFVTYSVARDSLVFDLSVRGKVEDVVYALGLRWWVQERSEVAYDVWGRSGSGMQRFQTAFANYVMGQPMSDDERARIMVTLGV